VIFLNGDLMRKKAKEPAVPQERADTVRHEIISALEGRTLSAKEISASVRIPEKEVYGHLDHIHKTMTRRDRHLVVTPAQCLKCGFVFKKRERLTKPGRCPVCHGELIEEPLFSIRESPE
jgi:predicted Zn-ribbon and HTH transcriptional regulator